MMLMQTVSFKNDSTDERSQRMTAAIRLLDSMVRDCFINNKINIRNQTIKLVIYVGEEEYSSMASLECNGNGLVNIDGHADTYRGVPVYRVNADSHCRVFCLNQRVK